MTGRGNPEKMVFNALQSSKMPANDRTDAANDENINIQERAIFTEKKR